MSSNPPWPSSKKLRLCSISFWLDVKIFTILIFPPFSVIIISSLLINDDPQGLFNDVIFLNFKFSANEIEIKLKKINMNKKIFINIYFFIFSFCFISRKYKI